MKVKNKINQENNNKKITIKKIKIKYDRWRNWRRMELENNFNFINYPI